MLFGWRVVKHVKSNAIVYCAPDRTLGIGAGQMSRVDASRIAVWKAHEAGLSLKGSVVCSDAFFPFPDGLLAAATAGRPAPFNPAAVRDARSCGGRPAWHGHGLHRTPGISGISFVPASGSQSQEQPNLDCHLRQ
jgi:hypothetical protein